MTARGLDGLVAHDAPGANGDAGQGGRGRGPERLLTFAEAARALRVSLSTVRRMLAAGDLTSVRVRGRSPRIRLSVITAYLDAHETPPGGLPLLDTGPDTGV